MLRTRHFPSAATAHIYFKAVYLEDRQRVIVINWSLYLMLLVKSANGDATALSDVCVTSSPCMSPSNTYIYKRYIRPCPTAECA